MCKGLAKVHCSRVRREGEIDEEREREREKERREGEIDEEREREREKEGLAKVATGRYPLTSQIFSLLLSSSSFGSFVIFFPYCPLSNLFILINLQ